jgi:hypothetical protein
MVAGRLATTTQGEEVSTPRLDWAVNNTPTEEQTTQYVENQAAAQTDAIVDSTKHDSASDSLTIAAVAVVGVTAIAGVIYWMLHRSDGQHADLETHRRSLAEFKPSPCTTFTAGLLPNSTEDLTQDSFDLRGLGGAFSLQIEF